MIGIIDFAKGLARRAIRTFGKVFYLIKTSVFPFENCSAKA